jgi:hypothetical protein
LQVIGGEVAWPPKLACGFGNQEVDMELMRQQYKAAVSKLDADTAAHFRELLSLYPTGNDAQG